MSRMQRRDTKAWDVWSQLADKFLSISDVDDDDKSTPTRLQRIGALEESILMIERAIYEMGEPDDPIRDKALAHLYYAYSKTLLSLTGEDCFALAKDPHTMLMGAELVQEASTNVCRENAENHLRNAATLDATHLQAAVLLADVLGQQADGIHQRKPKEFVAELFDSFAESFDEKLVKGLAYRVPELVGQAAAGAQRQGQYYKAVLDAGCGTGLAGRHLRPLVPTGVLIGVDASEKMLDIARQCTFSKGCGLEQESSIDVNSDAPLYNKLFAMDLEEMSVDSTLYTVGSTKSDGLLGFDLVVAADVLVYFGRLDSVLASFASVSAHGAVLIFSCERTSGDEAPLGWRLLPSGRFAHTKEHAVQAASVAGYELKGYAEIVPRMEKGEPVQGHLFTFVLQASRSDEL
eukprot:scaffold1485_cov171-Amphora_coffeaeformis.AAC.16